MKPSLNARKMKLNLKVDVKSEPAREALGSDGEEEQKFILLEDYDATIDDEFRDEILTPYLKDLYTDLMMRSSTKDNLDKVTFLEYTKLPGIINDRLHHMFSEFKKKGSTYAQSAQQQKEKLRSIKKDDFVTQESFMSNLI